jgi:hypothetical protein
MIAKNREREKRVYIDLLSLILAVWFDPGQKRGEKKKTRREGNGKKGKKKKKPRRRGEILVAFAWGVCV